MRLPCTISDLDGPRILVQVLEMKTKPDVDCPHGKHVLYTLCVEFEDSKSVLKWDTKSLNGLFVRWAIETLMLKVENEDVPTH